MIREIDVRPSQPPDRASATAAAISCLPRSFPADLPRDNRSRSRALVTAKFKQAFVANPEMVSDFVEHNPSHFPAKRLRTVSAESNERTAENRDLVRKHRCVIATASRERHALIETKERLAGRWLLFYDELYIGHPRTQIRRQRFQCVLRIFLKPALQIGKAGPHDERVVPQTDWSALSTRSSRGHGSVLSSCRSTYPSTKLRETD